MHGKAANIYEETADLIEARTGLNVWFVEIVGKRKSFLGGKFQQSFTPPIEVEISPRIHMFIEVNEAAPEKSTDRSEVIEEAISIAKSKLL